MYNGKRKGAKDIYFQLFSVHKIGLGYSRLDLLSISSFGSNEMKYNGALKEIKRISGRQLQTKRNKNVNNFSYHILLVLIRKKQYL